MDLQIQNLSDDAAKVFYFNHPQSTIQLAFCQLMAKCIFPEVRGLDVLF